MTRVSVFGLTVESEIPLPAPAARDTAVDVSIRYGRVPPTLDGARLEGRGFASHERATLLRLRDVGRFLVRDGREIIVDPAPGAQPAWILHPLLAGVMGAVLQARGVLTLHASAVRIGDTAVVLAGHAGTGKSTLAAYLARLGHVVQSDGFVAIADVANTPTVLPGPAAQKLWPDAAECLGVSGGHPCLMPATTKRLVAGHYPGAAESAPIAQILVLGTGIDATHPRLQGRQRVLDLTDHRFLPNTVHGQTGRQAAQLLALAQKVAVGRLARAPGPIDASLASMSQDVLRCLQADSCVESAHVTTKRLPAPCES